MDFPNNFQPRLSSSAYIPPHRTQLHPRMISIYSSSSQQKHPSNSNKHQSKLLFFLPALFTIPFFFYLFTTAQKVHSSTKFAEPKSTFFGVVINAGSSGSKINVFEFLGEGRIPFLDEAGSSSMKVRPGLMDFVGEPDGAGGSILKLVQFGKQMVPKKEWGDTKVLLMATAELESLSSNVREKILNSCRRVLKASGFLFKDEWARVVQGEEQGISSWVAVNYALGNLGHEPQVTRGIVELGGASLQVTSAMPNAKLQPSRRIKLSGVTYSLYGASWTQFGQDVAWKSLDKLLNDRQLKFSLRSSRRVLVNPCIPRGFPWSSNASYEKQPIQPAGNFSTCRSEALSLLKSGEDICLHPPCKITSTSFELSGKQISAENFLYISEFFGTIPRASLFELEAAGQRYCEDHWDALKSQHNEVDDMDLLKHCFSSAYMVALLRDFLRIPMEETRVGLGNQRENTNVDWTLGLFIIETMAEPLELESEDTELTVGNESVTYFSLFAMLLLSVLAAFLILLWRKPQLKTVYDLEKGRYIVTHVPR